MTRSNIYFKNLGSNQNNPNYLVLYKEAGLPLGGTNIDIYGLFLTDVLISNEPQLPSNEIHLPILFIDYSQAIRLFIRIQSPHDMSAFECSLKHLVENKETRKYRITYEGCDPKYPEIYFNRYNITITTYQKPTLESLITQKRIYQCFQSEIVKKFSVEEI